jgi:hypothetical protein
LIIKEKFSIKKRANFNLKKSVEKNIKNKLDLVALIELNNHIYYIFNYIYANITTLIINILLY